MKNDGWRPLRWQKQVLLSPPSNAQLVSNLHVQKYKSLKAERIFFGMNAQNIFFQLPNLKKDIVRDRSGYCVPGENKTKAALWIIWGSSSYMTYLTPCRNVFKECDKQTIKWGIPVTKILNTCTRYSNKHLFETSCRNNKSFDQNYSAWN